MPISSSLLLRLLFLIPFSNSNPEQIGPTYMRQTFNATEFPAEEDYDYIIVGGGTAGCPLAATLSHEYRVLILERGGSSLQYPNTLTQEGFLPTLVEFDDYDSPAQAFTSLDGVPNTRGRILGGSSAINAGFYTRADEEFFRAGPLMWDMELVNSSYEWVERVVMFRPELRSWQSAFRDSLLEANVTPYNGFSVDHVVGTKIGGTTFDGNGRRHSAADLLVQADLANLSIALHASVERVLLSSRPGGQGKQYAIGVVYRDRLGQQHHAMTRAGGEVILCAGALGSPQLLLLSGIGPSSQLSRWGIPAAHILNYVGRYMFDNPRNGISITSPMPLNQSLIQVVGISEPGSGFFIEAASSVLPFLSPPRPIFIGRPISQLPLQLPVGTLMAKLRGPESIGSLHLASTDVRDNPSVQFNYFTNQADMDRCIRGMRKISEVLRSRGMEEFKFDEGYGRKRFRFVGPTIPENEMNDWLMAALCRRTLSTIWHYHGGCLVGKVVDTEYRLIGIGSLRVVDGSTFSISPGTNPQATVMMLGRYVGKKMLMERKGFKHLNKRQ